MNSSDCLNKRGFGIWRDVAKSASFTVLALSVFLNAQAAEQTGPAKSALTDLPGSGDLGGGFSIGGSQKPKFGSGGKTGEASTKGRTDRPGTESRKGTEISSQGGLNYDPKESKAVFTGAVQVTHPMFDLSCEILTAYLNRSKLGKDSANSAQPEGATKGAAADKSSAGLIGAPSGLEKAVAEGRVVILQEKKNEKGQTEKNVGRAEKVVYEAATGNITLIGWPKVEQNLNTITSEEESTVMVMNKNGKVEVQGKSKTVLRDSKIED